MYIFSLCIIFYVLYFRSPPTRRYLLRRSADHENAKESKQVLWFVNISKLACKSNPILVKNT